MNPFQEKLAMLVFLLIVSVSVASSAFAFQNEPDGFKGIKWGTNINQLSDMVFYEGTGDEKWYNRKNDNMKIGDADIDNILYRFYKNRFCGVLIRYSEYSNLSKLKAFFFGQYSQPDQQTQSMEKYDWWGGTVNIRFDYSKSLKRGNIGYFFIPIHEQEKMDNIEKQKKGAKKL